jgi:prepilin-type N-terminal cleavage/methylation domain-containing protein
MHPNSCIRAQNCGREPAHDPVPISLSAKGFSLIEVMIALVVVMIAMLGIFTVFTYAIMYNAGNKSRSGAIAVLQQEVERIRAAKFNTTTTDPVLQGGTQAQRTVTGSAGSMYTVDVSVDNAPDVGGIQPETYQCLTPQNTNVPCTLKEVVVTVRLAAPSPGWQTAVPATVTMRRVRAN